MTCRLWHRASVALSAAALLVGGLTPIGAQAAPVVRAAITAPHDARKPSLKQIQASRRAAAAAKKQIAALEKSLADTQSRLEDAQTQAEIAAEAYDGAAVELAAKDEAATAASGRADTADRAYRRARTAVAAFAAELYREGGDFSSVEAFLGGTGPGDVLQHASTVDAVSSQQQGTIERLTTARAVATDSRQRAAAALADQKAATTALAGARVQAVAAADRAQAAVLQIQAQQKRDQVRLAALQHTTVVLVRRRQRALAEEARQRAEEAARRERERERQKHHGGGDSGSDSGSGSGSDDSSGSSGGSGTSSAAEGRAAVAWARTQLGKPYVWGADGPGSYDCSGLVMRAWQQAGVSLVHHSSSQWNQVDHISYSNLRPGDLIFYAYNTSRSSTIHHVAMAIGGGMMIEAPHAGASVRIVPIRWSGSMPSAGRP